MIIAEDDSEDNAAHVRDVYNRVTASGAVYSYLPKAGKLRELDQTIQDASDGKMPTRAQAKGLEDQMQHIGKLEEELANVRISNAAEFQQMLKTKPFKSASTSTSTTSVPTPNKMDAKVHTDLDMKHIDLARVVKTVVENKSKDTPNTTTPIQDAAQVLFSPEREKQERLLNWDVETAVGTERELPTPRQAPVVGTQFASGSSQMPMGMVDPLTEIKKSVDDHAMEIADDQDDGKVAEAKQANKIHMLHAGDAMPSKGFKDARDMTWLHEALALKNQGNEEFKAKDYLPAARSYTAALILVYDNELRVNVSDTDLVLYSELLHSRSKALYQLKAWPLALADVTLIPEQCYTLKTWQQRAEIAGAFGLYEEQKHCLEAQISYFTDKAHGGVGEVHDYDKIKQLRSRVKNCKTKLDLVLSNLERKTHDSIVPMECPYVPFVFWTARDLGLEYNSTDESKVKASAAPSASVASDIFTPAAVFMKDVRSSESKGDDANASDPDVQVLRLMQQMTASVDSAVEFKMLPGRGFGMVAKRDIKPKEVVWREKPLLFAEVGKTLKGTSIRGLCDMCGSNVSVVQVKSDDVKRSEFKTTRDSPPVKEYELQPLAGSKTKTDKDSLITGTISQERTRLADALLSAPQQDIMVTTLEDSSTTKMDQGQDKTKSAKERSTENKIAYTVVRGAHVSCQYCPYESYCSEQCRDTAYKRYHKSLCGLDYERLRSMAIESGDLSWRIPILIFKLIGMARNNGKRTPMQLPIVDHWLELTRDRLSKTKVPHSGTRLINCFQQVSDTSQSFGDPLLDAQFYDAMEQMISSCSHSSLSKMDSNQDTVAAERMMGVGLFPGASMINHSCEPNADWSIAMDRKAQGLEIVSTRKIAKGQEICYSYVPEELPYTRRAKRLWEQQGFICDCNRCKKDRCKGVPPLRTLPQTKTKQDTKAKTNEQAQKTESKSKTKS